MYSSDNKQRFVPFQSDVWWAQKIGTYTVDLKIFECPSADGDAWRNCGCGAAFALRPIHYGANCGAGGSGGTAMPNWQGPMG
jgi:hypothetical protein